MRGPCRGIEAHGSPQDRAALPVLNKQIVLSEEGLWQSVFVVNGVGDCLNVRIFVEGPRWCPTPLAIRYRIASIEIARRSQASN